MRVQEGDLLPPKPGAKVPRGLTRPPPAALSQVCPLTPAPANCQHLPSLPSSGTTPSPDSEAGSAPLARERPGSVFLALWHPSGHGTASCRVPGNVCPTGVVPGSLLLDRLSVTVLTDQRIAALAPQSPLRKGPRHEASPDGLPAPVPARRDPEPTGRRPDQGHRKYQDGDPPGGDAIPGEAGGGGETGNPRTGEGAQGHETRGADRSGARAWPPGGTCPRRSCRPDRRPQGQGGQGPPLCCLRAQADGPRGEGVYPCPDRGAQGQERR